jgi:endonuclease/exonuclease/phosphatase family metal-dependent hydrolase
MAASQLPRDECDELHTGRDLLKVGSYNIHRCIGSDMRHDIERVARVIVELSCDTVGLQEVDTLDRQIDVLAAATGMRSICGPAPPSDARPLSNALLTTRDFGQVRRHDLTFRGREPRGALDVELSAGGQSVRVIVTHLGLSAAERRAQVQKLLTVVRGIPADCPVVILGDINEWWPLGRPLRWLHGALGKAPSGGSFPVWAPVLALDRLWCRPAATLLAVEVHRSSSARAASDHFPVKATVAPDAARGWHGGP